MKSNITKMHGQQHIKIKVHLLVSELYFIYQLVFACIMKTKVVFCDL